MNKVMVVTGGSRGLGAAIALLGGKRGYDICVNYSHDEEGANGVVSNLRALGGKAIAMRADVGSDIEVAALFKRVDAELGAISVLVNNAGISGPYSRVDTMELGSMRRLFETNVYGTLLCSGQAILRMSSKHGGRGGAIVNLSSAAGRLGGAGRNVHYAASKGAINSMTVGMAREVADEGIRVNAVSPGVIDTESQEPGRVAALAPSLPMRRAGLPEEVANAVLWLASDEASYVTGAIVDVSGGR
jgi:NAD(P)-dependent dehydrogenase (short-subunit alcohol dehydrogenase family)